MGRSDNMQSLKAREANPTRIQRSPFIRVGRNARTGELTPPGMCFNASGKSFSDLVRVMTKACLKLIETAGSFEGYLALVYRFETDSL